MKFTIISMSQSGLKSVGDLISEYEKRAQGFAKVESINLVPKKSKASLQERQAMDREVLLEHIPKQSLVLLCDENGKTYTSQDFAKFIEKSFLGSSHITFVLGPAYGLSKTLLKEYQSISFSPMTLQHEIAHLVLVEQLYRALSILNNHPYHL